MEKDNIIKDKDKEIRENENKYIFEKREYINQIEELDLKY